MKFNVKTNMQRFRARHQAIQPAIKEEVRLGLILAGNRAQAAFARARLRGAPGTIHTRSGKLADSLGSEVLSDVRATHLVQFVGGGLAAKYAKVHEGPPYFSGAITPKIAKHLAIPLGPEKTAAGVTRKRSPRDDPALFMIRSKAGNLLLVKRVGKGKNSRIQPHWLLKKSVTVPPRLGFVRSFREFVRTEMPKYVQRIRLAIAERLRRV